MFAAGKTSSGVGQTYVDDVFSTWLYDGSGSARRINNGIQLSDSFSITPGTFLSGGYFAGFYSSAQFGGVNYALIVAPKSQGETTGLQYKTTQTTDAGAVSLIDGLNNTAAIDNASHPAAQWCAALTINGFSDWYLPSRDELELLARYLSARSAITSNSFANNFAYPETLAYNFQPSSITTAVEFQSAGSEVFLNGYYVSSTQEAATTAYVQYLNNITTNGSQSPGFKDATWNVRAVRRVAVSDAALNPYRNTSNGGMVWTKTRSSNATTGEHTLADTARGPTKSLRTNNTNGSITANDLSSFNSNGFSVVNGASGESGVALASWTFRKAPKFFDVVTYTGDGVAGRTIAHSLGITPGMIIVKRTDTPSDWEVYHRSLANTEYMVLNTTAAKATDATMWNSTTPTASVFSLGTNTNVNASGGTYVAYIFGHDTSADGIIQCGTFTGSAEVTLGWEPQFVLFKTTVVTSDWQITDSLRGSLLGTNVGQHVLRANTTAAENSTGAITLSINPTGFNVSSAQPWVYLAIRRPNKPPTTGTQVFMPTVYTGTNVNNRLVDTTIAPDMVFVRQRNDATLAGMVVGDRLRGQPYLLTGGTAAEVTSATALDQQLVSATEYGTAFSAMNGFWVGTDATAKLNVNTTASNHIAEAFKRAPGVFDVVCYTGVGTTGASVAHQLGVVPELMIIKQRGGTTIPYVYVSSLGNTNYLELSSTAAVNGPGGVFGNTTPTASNFYVSSSANSGGTGLLYVAYLFATLVGISKVFSYTGNGTSQTINCGFTTGARFVLIKRTDSTGDWYVWDSARGIVAGNDPHLSLNSTAAEVTTDDSVDTDSTGFVVNQLAATNVNVTSATYIGLAFS